MLIRYSKILLAAALGALILLVAINNVTDYNTNFDIVSRVMSMAQVPAGSPLEWRAVASPALHRMFYAFIIAVEFAAGALILAGAWRLLLRRKLEAALFNAAKDVAIAGLALAVGLYLFGFMAVGGEWFQMWRSWPDAEQAAFRFIGCAALVLLFLGQRDD
jgi:predicted small integral membrane protein